MNERTLLPIRLPKPGRLRLPALLSREASQTSRRVTQLLECLEQSEVEAISILGSKENSWCSAPRYVVIHAPVLPEIRARFLGNLTERNLWSGGLLCLTPAEWGVWSRTPRSADIEELRPLWGAPQLSSARMEPESLQSRRLRAISHLALEEFHSALWHESDRVAPLGQEIRDRLEQEVAPTNFPPLWSSEATNKEIHASVLGAFHATFARMAVVEEEVQQGSLEQGQVTPTRNGSSLRNLLSTLLSDLPSGFISAEVLALYLMPRSWGSRLSWNLVAVVTDDAPLDRCAELRFALQQHLRMLPRREVRSVFDQGGGVEVVPRSTIAGIVRKRLFSSPLQHLSMRRHRVLLLGSDVLEDTFEGPDFEPENLAFELGQILEAVQSLWAESLRACDIHELFYGRLPALLGLLRGAEPSQSLAEAQAALSDSVDPAQAFAGREGSKAAWCDPSTSDLGRGREFLRDRGPMVVRMQEVVIEALLASETKLAEPDS